MKVAELMQRKVKTIGSEATVAEAIVSLADAHISGMPVVDGTGRVIGIVSSTDVLSAEAEAEGRTAREMLLECTTVRDVMTPRPYTIAPDEEVSRPSSASSRRRTSSGRSPPGSCDPRAGAPAPALFG